MKIEFKNGSSIESIGNASVVKRSQIGEEQIARMSEQIKYGQCNPDKYIEFIAGVKLPWYQKVLVRLRLIVSRKEYG
jgi:hypothetical protein